MQGIGGLFSVTAIFLALFLINMLKIQKIHFFLMLIYIIIEEVKCVPDTIAEEILQEISRETRLSTKKRRQCPDLPAEMGRNDPGNGTNYRETPEQGRAAGLRKVRMLW